MSMSKQAWPDIQLSDGNKIPAIAFGTGSAHYKDDSRDVTDAVKNAIIAGYRHIDAAQSSQNETCVRDALKEVAEEQGVERENLWITTKVTEGVKDVRKTLEAQLNKLGLKYMDAYFLHTPKSAAKEGITNVDLWKQMIALKKAGLARTIGVSNFRAYHLRELEECEEMPAINQMEYHPYVHKMFRPVLEYCREKHIMLEAYSSLSPINRFSGGPLDQVLSDIAEDVSRRSGEIDCNAGQVCMMYIHAIGGIPVTTSGDTGRMRETLQMQRLSDLLPEEIEALEKAGDAKPVTIKQEQADKSDYVSMPDSFD